MEAHVTKGYTQNFQEHEFYIALKQHTTYRPKSKCHQLGINNQVYNIPVNETYFQRQILPCMDRIAEVLHAWRPEVIKPLDRKQGFHGLWNHVEWFPSNVTYMGDGFPDVMWAPTCWEKEVRENPAVRDLFGWTQADVDTGLTD